MRVVYLAYYSPAVVRAPIFKSPSYGKVALLCPIAHRKAIMSHIDDNQKALLAQFFAHLDNKIKAALPTYSMLPQVQYIVTIGHSAFDATCSSRDIRNTMSSQNCRGCTLSAKS
eukprot:5156034-Pleurochrysis_carterae.AAC.4